MLSSIQHRGGGGEYLILYQGGSRNGSSLWKILEKKIFLIKVVGGG